MSKRQGFGSFHSEDIETLIRQPASEYGVPSIWVDMHVRGFSHIDPSIPFGRRFKEKFFALDPSWTFLNHGAFGGALLPLLEESRGWSLECERQPLKFFDRELLPLIAYSIRQMADYLNCPSQELLPLPNVTTGLNAIMNSVDLNVGDEVVCFSLTYGSTKKILQNRCHRSGASLRIVPIPLPIRSEEEISLELSKHLSERTRLVVIDHITSNTALLMPVMQLASICKERGALVVVDAAHCLFSQPIQLRLFSKDIDPRPSLSEVADAWLTNGHKWLCAPKGCAFMWFNPRTLGAFLRPAVVSHGFSADSNRVLSGFAWDGCRDYSAMLSVPSALRFWESIDEHRCLGARDYMAELCRQGRDVIRRAWRIGDEDTHCPEGMREGLPMTLVPLPAKLNGIDTTKDCSDAEAFQLQEWLHHEKRIEVPVKHLSGRLYVRISAHVYNELEDFDRLARAFQE